MLFRSQCYENQTAVRTAAECSSLPGESYYDERTNECYFSIGSCSSGHYVTCQCYAHRAAIYTSGSCNNFGGYYTNGRCYYNSSRCPDGFHSISGQCYRQSDHSDVGYTESTCLNIGEYYHFRPEGICYYDSFNCSGFIVDEPHERHCYLNRSATYSRATCTNIGGIYGYTYDDRNYRSGFGFGYDTRYYCLYNSCHYVTPSYRKCYSYVSASYDCSSCRLLDGFMYSGTCYHNAANCSQPLFLAGDGQCYENQTAVRTAAECSSFPGESYYDERIHECYFSNGSCSSGHFVNCQCYAHRAAIYTSGSCNNFGGYYTNGRCYYNSSHCPDRFHSISGQCYRQSDVIYSQSTCLNIGGYYHYRPEAGTCYYDSFNCSGFIVDERHCYLNRSLTYSRATCTNIGGIYGYLYDGRHYRSRHKRHRDTISEMYPFRRLYYCLYNNITCAG